MTAKASDSGAGLVAPDTFVVDLREGGQAERTAGFLIRAPRPALIETGGRAGVQAWLEALEQQGVPRDEIAYIILTHIHLDHAAGAGTLARLLPRAQVVVHPRGARHLQDPTRLVQGARTIFGDRLESLFGLPERWLRSGCSRRKTARPWIWGTATGCGSSVPAAMPGTST